MVDDSEFAVIFFVGSAYAFAIALLYALARAWEKSLSSVARPKPTGEVKNYGQPPLDRRDAASRK